MNNMVFKMAAKITMLNLVDGKEDRVKIKVRVIRLWHKTSDSNGDGNAMEMVLADEEGHKIHTCVKNHMKKSFAEDLKEGVVYTLSNFSVAANNTRFKMVPHEHKIHFTRKTSVVKWSGEFGGSIYGFSFADFVAISKFQVDRNLAMDVIGVLYSCGKIVDKNVSGRKCKLLCFELETIGGKKIECSLWDSLAEQLADHVANNTKSTPIVVIIQLGRIKEFNLCAQVTNCFYGTKLLLDAGIDVVADFRTAYMARKMGDSKQHSVLEYKSRVAATLMEDFLSVPKKKNDQLCDIKTLGKYVIVGKIIAVRMEPTWSYLACQKCFGGVVEDDNLDSNPSEYDKSKSVGLLKCKKMQFRRFRIQVRAQDETGTVSLTLFDTEVSNVIQKSAQEIYAQLPNGEEDDIMPVELNVFVGRTYVFKVRITDFELKTNKRVLTVSKITDDKEVLEKLVGVAATKQVIQDELTKVENNNKIDESSSTSKSKKRNNEEDIMNDSCDVKRPASALQSPKK